METAESISYRLWRLVRWMCVYPVRCAFMLVDKHEVGDKEPGALQVSWTMILYIIAWFATHQEPTITYSDVLMVLIFTPCLVTLLYGLRWRLIVLTSMSVLDILLSLGFNEWVLRCWWWVLLVVYMRRWLNDDANS